MCRHVQPRCRGEGREGLCALSRGGRPECRHRQTHLAHRPCGKCRRHRNRLSLAFACDVSRPVGNLEGVRVAGRYGGPASGGGRGGWQAALCDDLHFVEPFRCPSERGHQSRPADVDAPRPLFPHGIRRQVRQYVLQVGVHRDRGERRTPAGHEDNGRRRGEVLHVLGRELGVRRNERRPHHLDAHRGRKQGTALSGEAPQGVLRQSAHRVRPSGSPYGRRHRAYLQRQERQRQ